MNTNSNVSEISSVRLCNSCGACQHVCPEQAITYEETVGGYYMPSVDKNMCIKCGVCSSVCPGAGFNKRLLNSLPDDPFVGNAIGAFVGKARDKVTYRNSQSGGVVAALLNFGLDQMGMGGALTVAMPSGSPPRPRPKIVRNKAEIIQSQKSKYCPVPLLCILEQIEPGDDPVAVVGIPCQVHGLQNVIDRFPALAPKIGIIIGLFCDRIMTYAAIDYLMSAAGFSDSEKATFHFRDKKMGGYPGKIHIQSEKKSIVLPKEARINIKDQFTPVRCRLCYDKLNVFADISIGDPWGIQGVDKSGGESVAVIRSTKGKAFFDRAVNEGYIKIREIGYSEILSGQRIDIKRGQWLGFINAWEKMKRPLPNYSEAIIPFAGSIIDGGFEKLLEQALNLDTFSSRAALIRSIRWKSRISKWRQQAGFTLQVYKKGKKYVNRRVKGNS